MQAAARLEASKLDPIEDAKAASLRYVSDLAEPGITRERAGRHFAYRDPRGRIIHDPGEIDRINKLAVPPAWTQVWICPDRRGHLQATGRDARGRKQYRYHPRWRAIRDSNKFEHILDFGKALPRIRQRVEEDLAKPGLSREKVLAAVIRLMEMTLARVGNSEYVRQNHSFGITTLKNRHVRIKGGKIELDFLAKSNTRHHSVVTDRKLARILRNIRDLPGSELFQYLDETGERHVIDSSDVNDYLRRISGEEITAKDLRTWAATNLAFRAFCGLSKGPRNKKKQLQVIKDVAIQLGNTAAVCRKCYIHPAVLNGYLVGTLHADLSNVESEIEYPQVWLAERHVIRFLRSAAADLYTVSNGTSHRTAPTRTKVGSLARGKRAIAPRFSKRIRHA
jgi:DNA topoisomerase-1